MSARLFAEREIRTEVWPPGYRPGGLFISREREIQHYFSGDEATKDSDRALARPYRVMGRGELLGCFALQADAVRLDAMERPDDVPYLFAPAIKLARFGRNDGVGKVGIRLDDGTKSSVGQYMMNFIIGLARELNRQIAVRYISLDALNRADLVDWYEEIGFKRTNVPVLDDAGKRAEEVNMLLDVLR